MKIKVVMRITEILFSKYVMDSKIVKRKMKDLMIIITLKIKMIELQFYVLFTCNSSIIVGFMNTRVFW
jgi:hypothetical protein